MWAEELHNKVTPQILDKWFLVPTNAENPKP
jgi:hypothetical protein